MKLTGLTLYHFRNYEELHLALHPGVNLLVGENAQGRRICWRPCSISPRAGASAQGGRRS